MFVWIRANETLQQLSSCIEQSGLVGQALALESVRRGVKSSSVTLASPPGELQLLCCDVAWRHPRSGIIETRVRCWLCQGAVS